MWLLRVTDWLSVFFIFPGNKNLESFGIFSQAHKVIFLIQIISHVADNRPKQTESLNWPPFIRNILLVWFIKRTLHHTEYLLVFRPNAGKYGPENLRIRTLFTQWICSVIILYFINLYFKFFMVMIDPWKNSRK